MPEYTKAPKCECKDCDKRHPACHDTCESYQAFRKYKDAVAEAKRKALQKSRDLYLYRKETIEKIKKKRGKK